MATAPREDQIALLELAELDAGINRISAQIKKHPLHASVTAATVAVDGCREELKKLHDAAKKYELEAEELNLELEKIADLIAGKEAKLRDGSGLDSRELLTLQGEIDTWKQKASEISDAEFELLALGEEIKESIETHAEALEQAEAMLARVIGERDADLRQLDGQRKSLEVTRAAAAAQITPSLIAAYDSQRERGGVGVVGVRSDGSTSSGLFLSPVEAQQVLDAPADEVIISEEHDCILVRLD
ncbi:MAG: hypothetical protein SPG61_05600 [Arcanobacterium sp.]|nr:hypothetical protein [Arcanobacterium sp.]